MDTVDAVYSERSRIVVYGGGDIVFDRKRSNQWTQYAVCSGYHGIVVYGSGDIVHCVTASTALTFLHQRTMSPPPYTTIPLRTAYCVL